MDPLPTLDNTFLLVLIVTFALFATAIYFSPGTLSVSRPNNAWQRLWRMRRVDRMETVGTYMIRALENAAVIVLLDTAFLVTANIGLIIVAAVANLFVLFYWTIVAQRLVESYATRLSAEGYLRLSGFTTLGVLLLTTVLFTVSLDIARIASAQQRPCPPTLSSNTVSSPLRTGVRRASQP